MDHPSKHMATKLAGLYQEMNRFAHIDPVAVLSTLHREGEKTIIEVGVTLKSDSFQACTYGISLWLGNYLDALSTLVAAGHDWHDEQQDSIDAVLAFIDKYNAATGGIQLPYNSLEDDVR